LGIGRHALAQRLQAGRLHRVHQGVYALGRPQLTPNGHRLAAVLACGPSAVLSHKSAGQLWDLLRTSQMRIDVTVPGTSRRDREGIRIHRTRALDPADTGTLNGIPVTSVPRTVVDLAAVLNRDQTLRVVEQGARLECLDFGALRRTLDRNPNHKGRETLRLILADFTAAPVTRSDFERDFLAIVTDAGLPKPQMNSVVAGLEVDACWPDWELIVELDSRGFHSDPRAFERDRLRDARLQRAGFRVLRVTYRRLKTEPSAVIADICALAALSRRRAS
ncbi:MAG: DUF559 domain-containing protein, partial [Solirubrobacteraceae bacterium]